MKLREQIIAKVLENAKGLLGTDYSQSARFNIWPGGSMDCSSFTAAIWSAAGFPLRGSNGAELLTSCYQVNAAGFKLVWPTTMAQVGKQLPSPKGLLSSYGAEPGDIVFWNFDKATTRANKITHVGSIDANAHQIIHTANNKEKCCTKPLSYGDRSICAIIRLRDDFTFPILREIQRPSEGRTRPEEWMVRMLQTAFNFQRGNKLVVDGLFGPKLEAVVSSSNAMIGSPGVVCTMATWSALGFGSDAQVPTPEIAPESAAPDQPTVLKITKPLMKLEAIALMQDAFGLMGYDCGGIDGVCGEKTMAGIAAFVAAHK